MSKACKRWLAGVALSLVAASAQALPPQLFKPHWILPTVAVQGPPAAQRNRLQAEPVDLSSVRYERDGQRLSIEDFQSRAEVKALLVLKDGKLAYEHHRWPNGPQTLHQSWSMMKQMLSALVGLAVQQGQIRSIDDPMDRYAPALAANGFQGVTFRQALLMSAGVRYVEEVDRVQLFMDVIRHRVTLGLSGRDLRDKAQAPELDRAFAPGSRHEYASIVSQALGQALEAATGRSLSTLLSQGIWRPLGMPDDARLMTDAEGNAFGLCCLYASARSYALFGQWFAQGGQWQGRPLLSEDWVHRSTGFADPLAWHAPAVPRAAKTQELFGFAYHWWPLEGGRGDFTALGIQGQMIYVSPRQNVVVVRISEDLALGAHNEEAIALFRAIADRLKPLN
ncbi:MAG: serine hydrolase [Burkholderiales bacterium]|nr:serine hydrolase [Burkholderiales bacterium]MBH2016335.1 serine hydrolase [Burkholderiales bacterium]